MPQTHPPYLAEYRRRIIEMVRAGRSVNELAREFEPSANAIRYWLKQAGLDEGLRSDGLTTDERTELNRLRRENRVLREERKILAKAAAWFATETGTVPSRRFQFVSANQAIYGVATMCRVLAVSASGYYAWRQRSPSARARADAELGTRIRAIHQYSRGTYGAPRIHQELRAAEIRVGCKRVARLLKAASLRGASRRQWLLTTVRDRHARPARALVERNFTAAAPDCLWVADITCIPTWAGFLYLAVVLDVFSRRIVGWPWPPICVPNSRRSTWPLASASPP
jgi:transposase-like protein